MKMLKILVIALTVSFGFGCGIYSKTNDVIAGVGASFIVFGGLFWLLQEFVD